MVAGKGVNICDECSGLVAATIAGQKAQSESTTSPPSCDLAAQLREAIAALIRVTGRYVDPKSLLPNHPTTLDGAAFAPKDVKKLSESLRDLANGWLKANRIAAKTEPTSAPVVKDGPGRPRKIAAEV